MQLFLNWGKVYRQWSVQILNAQSDGFWQMYESMESTLDQENKYVHFHKKFPSLLLNDHLSKATTVLGYITMKYDGLACSQVSCEKNHM